MVSVGVDGRTLRSFEASVFVLTTPCGHNGGKGRHQHKQDRAEVAVGPIPPVVEPKARQKELRPGGHRYGRKLWLSAGENMLSTGPYLERQSAVAAPRGIASSLVTR